METKMYLINALSNMHVGSGDVNYGIIDNMIQRDLLTGLPNINSSGLKGAIREFFRDTSYEREIFGSRSDDSSSVTMPGKFRFFEANLLSFPARSDKVPFLMTTSYNIIQEIIEKLDIFQCEKSKELKLKLQSFIGNSKIKELNHSNKREALVFDPKLAGACIEEVDLKATYCDTEVDQVIFQLFGERLVLLPHKILSELCDDNHLPVIARNCLEDGMSENLWYEQILPRYTRMYFMLMPGNIDAPGDKTDFLEKLSDEIFQLGANASIGYGYCKFVDISTLI